MFRSSDHHQPQKDGDTYQVQETITRSRTKRATGTYAINSECAGTATINCPDGSWINLELVVVDQGPEFRTVVSALTMGGNACARQYQWQWCALQQFEIDRESEEATSRGRIRDHAASSTTARRGSQHSSLLADEDCRARPCGSVRTPHGGAVSRYGFFVSRKAISA